MRKKKKRLLPVAWSIVSSSRDLTCPLQYTEELLRQQQFLEVYLEGTRSRSGKPSTARAGMLSIVVDALRAGSIGDVLVVPVGISYDRIIEGNYNSEQLVRPLVRPSSTRGLAGVAMPELFRECRASPRRTRACGE